MKKKAAIARGVASVMAVTMFTSVSASVLMFDNAGVINQALNLSTSKIVELAMGKPQTRSIMTTPTAPILRTDRLP